MKNTIIAAMTAIILSINANAQQPNITFEEYAKQIQDTMIFPITEDQIGAKLEFKDKNGRRTHTGIIFLAPSNDKTKWHCSVMIVEQNRINTYFMGQYVYKTGLRLKTRKRIFRNRSWSGKGTLNGRESYIKAELSEEEFFGEMKYGTSTAKFRKSRT